jgi:hypothetical protein
VAPAPSTRISIKIRYTTPYRGTTRPWSCRFHLNTATPPSDNAHWAALALALRNDLKAGVSSGIVIVGSTGYAAGSEVPVWTETVSVPGTLATGTPTTGDCAAMCRWTTDARSTKNHPVYLFNYFHGASWSGSGSSDTLLAAQKAVYDAFASKFASGGAGYSDGAVTYHRAGPYGAVGLVGSCDQYVRHRDFT